eukprot:gene2320-biopygen11404
MWDSVSVRGPSGHPLRLLIEAATHSFALRRARHPHVTRDDFVCTLNTHKESGGWSDTQGRHTLRQLVEVDRVPQGTSTAHSCLVETLCTMRTKVTRGDFMCGDVYTKTAPIELRVGVHYLREAKMVYPNSQFDRCCLGARPERAPRMEYLRSKHPTPVSRTSLLAEQRSSMILTQKGMRVLRYSTVGRSAASAVQAC